MACSTPYKANTSHKIMSYRHPNPPRSVEEMSTGMEGWHPIYYGNLWKMFQTTNQHTIPYLYILVPLHEITNQGSPTRLHPSIILLGRPGSSRSWIWTQIARVWWWFLVTIPTIPISSYILWAKTANITAPTGTPGASRFGQLGHDHASHCLCLVIGKEWVGAFPRAFLVSPQKWL